MYTLTQFTRILCVYTTIIIYKCINLCNYLKILKFFSKKKKKIEKNR